MTTIDMLVARSIARFRAELGMSRVDIARVADVTAARIADFESCRRRVDPRTLFRLAEVFGTGVESFFVPEDDDHDATRPAHAAAVPRDIQPARAPSHRADIYTFSDARHRRLDPA